MYGEKSQKVIYFENPKIFSHSFRKLIGLYVSEDIHGYTASEFIHLISGHPKFTKAYLFSKALEIGMLTGTPASRKFESHIIQNQITI